MTVSCWLSECKWNNNGWCHRGSITIDELKECEDYEHYIDFYTDAFSKAYLEDGKRYRRVFLNGKKIEYNGYVFYTQEKITDEETYCLTEERTGIDVGEFRRLKEPSRWKKFVEQIGSYPDVSTYPIVEKKGGK